MSSLRPPDKKRNVVIIIDELLVHTWQKVEHINIIFFNFGF